MKQRIELGAVQETMLLTLYARAVAAREGAGLLCDPRAVEIVEALDYDFQRLARNGSVLGSVLRTAILDAIAADLLWHAPAATVVEIGAGLNTRFERVDNGIVRWVDVDLPDAMRLRRRFFDETPRRRMVASSVRDRSWLEIVKASGPPYFLIAEGVFAYFQESAVRDTLGLIADELPGASILFDTLARTGGDAASDGRVRPGLRARLSWFCDDPHEIENWGLGYRLLESRSIADLPAAVDRRLPFSLRYSMAIARTLEWNLDAYRLNVFRAPGVPQRRSRP